MKMIWRIMRILTALAAGTMLYEGMQLVVRFQDRRTGVTVLAAGVLVAVLFGWLMHLGQKTDWMRVAEQYMERIRQDAGRARPDEEVAEDNIGYEEENPEAFRADSGGCPWERPDPAAVLRRNNREEAWTICTAGIAGIGALLYCMRYDMTRFATAALIGMVFWLFVLSVWFVIKRKKEEADRSFQEQLLLSGKRWEKREEEELSYLLVAAYLDQGSDGRKLWAVGSLLLGLLFILEGFRMIGEPRLEPRIGLYAAYVLVYAVLMLFGRSFLRLQTEKRMAEFLNEGMEEESSN